MNETPRINWPALLLILIFLILLIGVLIAVGLGNKKKSSQTTSPTSSSASVVESTQVNINKEGFSPATIKVKKGGSLVWTNKDIVVHRIVSDPHPTHTSLPLLDSDPLRENDSYSFNFEKTGTFGYHDENNPLTIKGIVVVE